VTVRPSHRKVAVRTKDDATVAWLVVLKRLDGREVLFSRHPPDADGKTAAARAVIQLRRGGMVAFLKRLRANWTPHYMTDEA
jgi:hypothetical protein